MAKQGHMSSFCVIACFACPQVHLLAKPGTELSTASAKHDALICHSCSSWLNLSTWWVALCCTPQGGCCRDVCPTWGLTAILQ